MGRAQDTEFNGLFWSAADDVAQLDQPVLNAFSVGGDDHVAKLKPRLLGGGLRFYPRDFHLPFGGIASGIGAHEQYQSDHDVEQRPCAQDSHAPALRLSRQAARIGGILLTRHSDEPADGQKVETVQSSGFHGGQFAAEVYALTPWLKSRLRVMRRRIGQSKLPQQVAAIVTLPSDGIDPCPLLQSRRQPHASRNDHPRVPNLEMALATPQSQQAGRKSNPELLDAHPGQLGEDEMSQFVHHNDGRQHDDYRAGKPECNANPTHVRTP